MDKQQTTITQMLDELASTVCDTLCRYTETIDDNCECQYIRENGECPLHKYI